VQLAGVYGELRQSGVDLIAISSDSPDDAAALRERLNVPFVIASDPDCETIRAFGVFHDAEPKGRSIARPATFLVDASGTIAYRYVGADKDDRPRTSDIVSVARSG
jgi:peroxiredoxin